ncbi:MAG TPA: hypothetical protein VF677_11125 [Flavobacterium sp.]|jgi:hypothetical protein
MSTLQNKFNLGELVVFKTHPLLFSYEIRGDGKYVPPIMIIKEVLFENKQKKTHDDISGLQIAERIKYICIYFDDNKSEFIESHIYEGSLEGIKHLKIGRLDDPDKLNKKSINLVDEVLNYDIAAKYSYNNLIYFKTKKLELLKKRASIKILEDSTKTPKLKQIRSIQYVVNYATPDFVTCGIKHENFTDLFYNDGQAKRIASKQLVKVKWFNPIQQKFSEEYLPLECFTNINPFPQISASTANNVEDIK